MTEIRKVKRSSFKDKRGPSKPFHSDLVLDLFLFWALVFGAWIRLQNIGNPIGPYWFDPAVYVKDAKNLVDLHLDHLIFPDGDSEPFFTYFLAGLWELFPFFKGLVIQRIGAVLIDVLAIYLFYLLGKEVSSKRAGVFMALLAAISKPMIIQCILGSRIVMIPMAVALMLWTLFRLIKEPQFSRFVQWGLATGFGLYTYTAIRPMVLFLVWVVFIWLILKSERKTLTVIHWVACMGTMVVATAIYFHKNNFLPDESKSFFESTLFNMDVCLWASIFVFHFLKMAVDRKTKDQYEWFGWAISMVVLGIVVYPLMADPLFAKRLSYLSSLHVNSQFAMDTRNLSDLLSNFFRTLKFVFYSGSDRTDMNLEGYAFFEPPISALIAGSLVFSVLKPSKMRFFLITAGFVGLVPEVLSRDLHSGRLMACIPPFFLLAAVIVEEVTWELVKAFRDRYSRALLYGGFSLVVVSTAIWNFSTVWHKYYPRKFNDVLVFELVKKDCDVDRVYLSVYKELYYFCFPEAQAVLNEGHEYYLFDAINQIPQRTNEKLRDVVVYFSGLDTATKNRLEKYFSDAMETVIPFPRSAVNDRHPEDTIFAYRFFIPATQILKAKNDIFQVRDVSDHSIVRKFYCVNYGLSPGFVGCVDVGGSLCSPFPAPVMGLAVKFEENCIVSGPSTALISVHTHDRAALWFNGQKVIEGWPSSNKDEYISSPIRMEKGVYPIVCSTYFGNDENCPEVTIK